MGGRVQHKPLGAGSQDLNAWKVASAAFLAHNRKPPGFEMFDRSRPRAARLTAAQSRHNMDRAVEVWPGATRQK